jgi:hypothetical protein
MCGRYVALGKPCSDDTTRYGDCTAFGERLVFGWRLCLDSEIPGVCGKLPVHQSHCGIRCRCVDIPYLCRYKCSGQGLQEVY